MREDESAVLSVDERGVDERGVGESGAGERTGADRSADERRGAGLTERECRILDFEQDAPVSPARKEAAIRTELGLTAPRYQQLLGSLIEKPAALAYAPMLVGRLLRLRDSRSAARSSRTFGR